MFHAIKIYIVDPCLSCEDLSEDTYNAACEKLEDCYTALEDGTHYVVYVRRSRKGEVSGTYLERNDGSLQILGYSVEIPQDLADLTEKAWNAYCKV